MDYTPEQFARKLVGRNGVDTVTRVPTRAPYTTPLLPTSPVTLHPSAPTHHADHSPNNAVRSAGQPPSGHHIKLQDELIAFTSIHNLPGPVFIVMGDGSGGSGGKHSGSTKQEQFFGKVVIGDRKFLTAPLTGKTGEEARELAAKKALTELNRELSQSDPSGPKAHGAVAKLMDAITEIVSGSPAGILDQGVREEFFQRTGRSLPDNWIQIIRSDERLNVETVKTFNKEITTISLRRRPSPVVRRDAPIALNTASASPHTANANGFSCQPFDPDHPLIQLDFPSSPLPEPDDDEDDIFSPKRNLVPVAHIPPAEAWTDFFDVKVTMVVDPSNFWIQAHAASHESSEYSTLKADMVKFFSDPENPEIPLSFDVIRRGTLLAARQKTNSIVSWHRVQVLSIAPAEDRVAVYLMDEGQFEKFPLSDLQPLYQQFRSLPQQAMKACLAGVRPVGSKTDDESPVWPEATTKTFKRLVSNKAFVTLIVKVTFSTTGDASGQPCVHLTMYDTSTDEDVNIGDLMIDMRQAARM